METIKYDVMYPITNTAFTVNDMKKTFCLNPDSTNIFFTNYTQLISCTICNHIIHLLNCENQY